MIMPISAQTSVGLKDRVPKKLAPWWDGPSLLEYLDGMQTLERKVKAPFMMPINGKYKVNLFSRSLHYYNRQAYTLKGHGYDG
jgi:translation elongation factor EF-1alpha